MSRRKARNAPKDRPKENSGTFGFEDSDLRFKIRLNVKDSEFTIELESEWKGKYNDLIPSINGKKFDSVESLKNALIELKKAAQNIQKKADQKNISENKTEPKTTTFTPLAQAHAQVKASTPLAQTQQASETKKGAEPPLPRPK